MIRKAVYRGRMAGKTVPGKLLGRSYSGGGLLRGMIPGKAIPRYRARCRARAIPEGDCGADMGASYRMPEPYRPGRRRGNGLVKRAGSGMWENKSRMPGLVQGG
ncbi:hypothetical protein EAI27_00765 [Alistipes onderdonkii]|jgi:hypothetical protein|nr:hypothetical protein [Alistipes onderdonkii]